MRIRVNKIISDKFQVREDFDKEHLASIVDSLRKDGQWNPIIVRPTKNGEYELIAGHYRLAAAKELGWTDIEATVRDFDEIESRILALKTNLLSKSMTEIEEGRILKSLMEQDGLTQKELAEKIGKSSTWVSNRLSLVLRIHDDVRKALTQNKITFELIPVIGTVDIKLQPKFLNLILEKNISNANDARKLRDYLQNDTIYTIGFMGKKIIEFLNILKDNQIDTVIDIRYNTASQFKPEFNQNILKRDLERDNIKYYHHQVFGVPPIIRDAVIAGFDSDCFRKWYRLNVTNIHKEEFKNFLEKIKDYKKCVLLCSESYPKPKGSQKHFCHRDFLADLIIEYSQKFKNEAIHFHKRVDL
ncbi:MAG: ParB/RepB/Spo0J family partition protein [Candidatus Hodarchaeales archaeon]